MKMYSLIIICIVLLGTTVLPQTKQSDRDFAGLKGNIKSVLSERADAKLKAGKIVESNRRKHENLIFQNRLTSHQPEGHGVTAKTALYFTDAAFEDLSRTIDETDVIANPFRNLHLMGGKNNRLTSSFQFEDDLFQNLHIYRIQPREGFIQN